MSAWTVLQNLAILIVATGLSIYFRNGWAFLLLLFWLSPSHEGEAR